MTERPAFRGIEVHRDSKGRYSMLVPLDWQQSAIKTEFGEGTGFAPDPGDPQTGLTVEARDLGTRVKPSDLPTLRKGFLAGLTKVSGSNIEAKEAESVGQLITMEARQTFREGEDTRHRWVRLLYWGQLQVRIVAQGSTPERFDYWEPMFFEAMRTFTFGDLVVS